MKEKFSKGSIAKFLYSFRKAIMRKCGFDYQDGIHQLETHFNKKLINAINDLRLPDNTENWDKIRNAERHIHEVIDIIIDYGKKEMAEIVSDHFDLADIIIKMQKKGEKIDE